MPPGMEAYMGVLGVNAVESTQYFWIEEVEVSYWIIIEDCTDNQNYESIQTSTSSMFTHPFPHCGNTLPRASIICFFGTESAGY